MNAAILIREFSDAGIRLSARGDKLHYEAPAGALTPDLRQRLLDHKPELLNALRLHAVGGANPTKLAMGRLYGTVPTGAPRIVADVRVNDHPSAWFTVLGRPGQAFDSIRYELSVQYGGRLVQVRQHAVRKPD